MSGQPVLPNWTPVTWPVTETVWAACTTNLNTCDVTSNRDCLGSLHYQTEHVTWPATVTVWAACTTRLNICHVTSNRDWEACTTKLNTCHVTSIRDCLSSLYYQTEHPLCDKQQRLSEQPVLLNWTCHVTSNGDCQGSQYYQTEHLSCDQQWRLSEQPVLPDWTPVMWPV